MEYELLDVIHDLGIFMIMFMFFISWMYFYTKYELKALKIDGYQELRLMEKSLHVDRLLQEKKLKNEIKLAKINKSIKLDK